MMVLNMLSTVCVKRSETPGMNAVSAAAPEESSDPDSPDLRSGLFNLKLACMITEA
jgi:hypothetical protein